MSDTNADTPGPEDEILSLADQIEALADSITVERRPPSHPLPPTAKGLQRRADL